MRKNKKRVVALFLPQYHPITENDKWWGKGFTEWRNVVKSRPRFKGHYQPHLPADLGFYDLRVPEVREQQAQLAEESGIYGFCYYHYWFNGHLLLERPLEEMLESRKPDFPFMLCWANENWTRAWDGGEKEILIKQDYSEEDDLNHIRYLMKFFKDQRYIKVAGKPVISIYRSTLCPDIQKTLSIWRNEALKEGFELYICRFESFNEGGINSLKGFDAAIEFQPHNKIEYLNANLSTYPKRLLNKISRRWLNRDLFSINISYRKYVDFQQKKELPNYKCYPSVTPMWDNAARRKYGYFAFLNSTPSLYYKWLKNVIIKFQPFSDDENFIFINAWNEWAEGNHLEPDLKWGSAYLEATKQAIDED